VEIYLRSFAITKQAYCSEYGKSVLQLLLEKSNYFLNRLY